MQNLFRIQPFFLALALSLSGCSRLRDLSFRPQPKTGEVTVTVEAPNVEEKYLDGIYWPQGKACGRAYTYWTFMCRPEFELKPVPAQNKPHTWVYKVAGVSIKTGLVLQTWLPFGVKDKLRAHEAGHIQMCREIYRKAGEVARQCGTDMLGRNIQSIAENEKQALDGAKTELTRTLDAAYREKMVSMADRAGVAFDRITNHGMNEVPEPTAMKSAFEEAEKTEASEKSEESEESKAPGASVKARE